MRRKGYWVLLLWVGISSHVARAADRVIWAGPSESQSLGIAAANLVDALLAEQQRIKTQPIVYRKIGIRPMAEGVFKAKAGDVLVRQVEYNASFIGRPLQDFRDSYGMPLHRASMTTVKMVNGGFCFASGSKCFFDRDRNGTWDRAGQSPKGRPVDIPFEVLELRREYPVGLSRELHLVDVVGDKVTFREITRMSGGLAEGKTCERIGPGYIDCEGFRIEVLSAGTDGITVQMATDGPPS